ncbi:hypothetical protein [Stenoxybacter acetivorans]|uniref:hypothetical protein n=1 Tax=Stenoxybacter acetivorans TaxID=422441 RepID=UPI00055DCFDB|nr:hypothetical protein [Stenoxybacter acetivorans]
MINIILFVYFSFGTLLIFLHFYFAFKLGKAENKINSFFDIFDIRFSFFIIKANFGIIPVKNKNILMVERIIFFIFLGLFIAVFLAIFYKFTLNL